MMTLPQRTFFTVQETTIRWDCSPHDLAGWAVAGKLEIVTAIEPIEQGGEILAGLVVVPVADILSMFRRWGGNQAARSIRKFFGTADETLHNVVALKSAS